MTDQPPLIRDRHGDIVADDYESAVKVIANLLSSGSRISFEYHHYSAVELILSHHAALTFVVSASYTGRRAYETTIWHVDRYEARDVAAALGLNQGHDTETVATLLSDLGAAIRADVERRGAATS